MDRRRSRCAATWQVGRFQVEIRWSSMALLSAYAFAGVIAAVAGGHLEAGGGGGFVVGAAAFAGLALGGALFHELGHAVAGLAFGRRPVGLVLKAGAAMQIEEAGPGSRGAGAAAEALVALAGPLASGLVGLAYLNVSSSITSAFAWAGLLALLDGLLNLVPVPHSDGNRILHALLDRETAVAGGLASAPGLRPR